jgi:hypothetical protein
MLERWDAAGRARVAAHDPRGMPVANLRAQPTIRAPLDKLSEDEACGGVRRRSGRGVAPALRPRGWAAPDDDGSAGDSAASHALQPRLRGPPAHRCCSPAEVRSGMGREEPRDRGATAVRRRPCSGPLTATAASPRPEGPRTRCARQWSPRGGRPDPHVNVRRRSGATRVAAELDGSGWCARAASCPELGWGRTEVLDRRPPAGALPPRRLGGSTVSGAALVRPIAARRARRPRAEVVKAVDPSSTAVRDARRRPLTVPLDPYGFRWFRMRRDGQRLPP